MMKNLLKFLAVLLGVIILAVAAMAVFNICPPQGPWPMPPWCPGSSISWPLSESSQQAAGESAAAPAEMSENERLARMAIGLMADLATVNTYFNDAASSLGEVKALAPTGYPGMVQGTAARCAAPSLQGPGKIPSGFLDPLPASGYIPAPAGACAVGASPSASFLTAGGNKITPELLQEKAIQVIDFEELTGGDIQGRKLESTLSSLITPGDQSLASSDGWNQKVWSQMEASQTPADSLMDYQLWTVASEIEAAIVENMAARLESQGLPSQVLNAFRNSQIAGWYASPPAEEADRIAAMEIEAEFTGRTEGTIYERRDFSLPNLGEMPVFGPMSGEGSVVYHDPELGDFPFELDISWTSWDQLGRVTAGEITFSDEADGVVIEMTTLEDDSRTADLYRDGQQVGVVRVSPQGEITYQDLTQ
jgi:hypothetical protein